MIHLLLSIETKEREENEEVKTDINIRIAELRMNKQKQLIIKAGDEVDDSNEESLNTILHILTKALGGVIHGAHLRKLRKSHITYKQILDLLEQEFLSANYTIPTDNEQRRDQEEV